LWSPNLNETSTRINTNQSKDIVDSGLIMRGWVRL